MAFLYCYLLPIGVPRVDDIHLVVDKVNKMIYTLEIIMVVVKHVQLFYLETYLSGLQKTVQCTAKKPQLNHYL